MILKVKNIYKHNKKLTLNAKILRNDMTSQERNLWYKFLRNYPVRILRQKVIKQYIVDFYCSKAKLVIEIDGAQHYLEEAAEKEHERTKTLEGFGLKVLRFTNAEVDNNLEGVCNIIELEINNLIKK